MRDSWKYNHGSFSVSKVFPTESQWVLQEPFCPDTPHPVTNPKARLSQRVDSRLFIKSLSDHKRCVTETNGEPVWGSNPHGNEPGLSFNPLPRAGECTVAGGYAKPPLLDKLVTSLASAVTFSEIFLLQMWITSPQEGIWQGLLPETAIWNCIT